MAYSTDNPPALAGGELTNSVPQTWVYRSADTAATVDTDGYITNADDLGMKVGDVVYVHDTTTPALSFHMVASVTAGGAADLLDAGGTSSADTD